MRRKSAAAAPTGGRNPLELPLSWLKVAGASGSCGGFEYEELELEIGPDLVSGDERRNPPLRNAFNLGDESALHRLLELVSDLVHERLLHRLAPAAKLDVRTAISDGIVALLKEFYGRGPDKAKTYVNGDLVVCLLRRGVHARRADPPRRRPRR